MSVKLIIIAIDYNEIIDDLTSVNKNNLYLLAIFYRNLIMKHQFSNQQNNQKTSDLVASRSNTNQRATWSNQFTHARSIKQQNPSHPNGVRPLSLCMGSGSCSNIMDLQCSWTQLYSIKISLLEASNSVPQEVCGYKNVNAIYQTQNLQKKNSRSITKNGCL